MTKKLSYRITKYNPELRDEWGSYLKEEWTSASDVGKQFSDEKLSVTTYLATEKAYVDSAISVWKLAQCPPLRVSGLENAGFTKAQHVLKHEPKLLDVLQEGPEPKDGQMLCEQEELARVIRLVLREFIWCRLHADNGFFLHFGWDYYMYCGGVKLTDDLRDEITKTGLFVEDFASPYLSKV